MKTLWVFIGLKIIEILVIGILPYILGRLAKHLGFDSHDIGMSYWICGFAILMILSLIGLMSLLFITLNWDLAKTIVNTVVL